MSSRTWINVGGAVVGGVLAFFTFGVSAILTGAALGYAAAGIIQGPAAPESGSMRPDEFQVVQSSESATIPVAFGTVRLAGNMLYYDKENFESVPVYQEQEGGKGGGSDPVQSGFQYRMTFDVGLCMGPIEALVLIQGSPGMDAVEFHAITEDEELTKPDLAGGSISRDDYVKYLAHFYEFQDEAPEGPIDLSGGAVTISMKGTKEDGGTATILPGNRTQAKYRDVAAVRFSQFNLGPSPAPRTYLFTIIRMPVVLDADGDVIAGFPVNAAVDPEDPEFGDANPAAIIWEVLTNKTWGKGVSADYLNQDDFKQAAIYFQASRIGISTSIGDDQSNVQLVNRFRELFGLVTWWDGNEIRCRALWDRANAYANRPRITPEDIIGEPAFSRQSMVASTNEVRLEFTNRQNNWQSEAATAQDLASIETIGGVRSIKIDGSEIGTRRAAELVAHRILRTLAYPVAICSVAVRRTFADLQPGEFVELVVDGWRGDAMTTFWRVDSVEDDLTGEDQIRVTMIEDIYATGHDGEVDDFTAPIPTIDDDDPLSNDDLVQIDYSTPTPIGEITPTLVIEPNIWVSKNERRLLVAIQRRSGTVQSFGVGYREAAAGNYQNAGVFQGFAFTGTLLDAVPVDGPKIIRQTFEQFRLTLSHEADATRLLSSASAVQAASDGLDILTANNTAIMVIGSEIFRVGHIEETGTNEFTVRVAIRSEFGTDKALHSIASTFHFFPYFDRDKMTAATQSLPIGLSTDVAITPNTIRGSGEPVFENHTFGGESLDPLRPELVSATRAGLVWTIKLRPRIFDGGSGFGPSLNSELAAREGGVGNHRLRVKKSAGVLLTLADYFATGAEGTAAMTATSFTFTPPDGTSPTKGVWTLVVEFDTNPTDLTVFALLGGRTSAPLTIPQPA